VVVVVVVVSVSVVDAVSVVVAVKTSVSVCRGRVVLVVVVSIVVNASVVVAVAWKVVVVGVTNWLQTDEIADSGKGSQVGALRFKFVVVEVKVVLVLSFEGENGLMTSRKVLA
jgi:hypothetical protein